MARPRRLVLRLQRRIDGRIDIAARTQVIFQFGDLVLEVFEQQFGVDHDCEFGVWKGRTEDAIISSTSIMFSRGQRTRSQSLGPA